MFASPRSSRFPPFIILAVGLITIFAYYRNPFGASLTEHSGYGYTKESIAKDAANATLGFGGLFLVSAVGSDRREHMQQRAAVTGLELTIPDQIQWTGEDVLNFRWHNVTESRVGIGSVKAWLSHHLVLRAFLDSGLETALIFEDDVDWDIRLRLLQVPLAQKAAQSLAKKSYSKTKYPWSAPSEWDLLYLGHCGDYFRRFEEGIGVGYSHPNQLVEIDHIVYDDPTLLDRTNLHPFTASLLTALSVPEHKRILHRSKYPLCSFGYAVTRQAATKILKEVAPPKEELSRHITAYDVALLNGCKDGPLKCFSITPELFHHMKGESLIGSAEENTFLPPVDRAGLEQTKWRMETSNIGCGFYSGEFYYDADPGKLDILKEEIGRKGRCMKEGRD